MMIHDALKKIRLDTLAKITKAASLLKTCSRYADASLTQAFFGTAERTDRKEGSTSQ